MKNARSKRKQARRTRKALTFSTVRSALTNGSTLFLADVDHRCAWARRLRDLVADHVSDLGGADSMSAAETILVKRASMLVLQLEMLEGKFAEQDGIATTAQLETYQRLVNTTRRTLESLGLKRRAKDVTPTLDEYMAGKRRRDADEAEIVG